MTCEFAIKKDRVICCMCANLGKGLLTVSRQIYIAANV